MKPASLGTFSVYRNRAFARFQKKASIPDDALWRAARAAEQGLVSADLGGGVIKQRLARKGEGKSGGSRSIILFRREARAVFVYGFEKKDRANIRAEELEAFRELASIVLSDTDADLSKVVEQGALEAVTEPERGKHA